MALEGFLTDANEVLFPKAGDSPCTAKCLNLGTYIHNCTMQLHIHFYAVVGILSTIAPLAPLIRLFFLLPAFRDSLQKELLESRPEEVLIWFRDTLAQKILRAPIY